MIRKDGTVSVRQIFKVMAWVSQKNKLGNWIDLYRKSQVIIANPARAREIYEECKNQVEVLTFYSERQPKIGKCLLFVPHIHENGELAYWPDDEKYIEKFEKEN